MERSARAGWFSGIRRTQNPVERIEQNRRRPDTILIKHSQIDYAGAGRNALVGIAAGRAYSSRRRSHVRTVTEGIVGRIILSREILAEFHAGPAKKTAATKRGVCVVDAGIKHGDSES